MFKILNTEKEGMENKLILCPEKTNYGGQVEGYSKPDGDNNDKDRNKVMVSRWSGGLLDFYEAETWSCDGKLVNMTKEKNLDILLSLVRFRDSYGIEAK